MRVTTRESKETTTPARIFAAGALMVAAFGLAQGARAVEVTGGEIRCDDDLTIQADELDGASPKAACAAVSEAMLALRGALEQVETMVPSGELREELHGLQGQLDGIRSLEELESLERDLDTLGEELDAMGPASLRGLEGLSALDSLASLSGLSALSALSELDADAVRRAAYHADRAGYTADRIGFRAERAAYQAERVAFSTERAGYETDRIARDADRAGYGAERIAYGADRAARQAERVAYRAAATGEYAHGWGGVHVCRDGNCHEHVSVRLGGERYDDQEAMDLMETEEGHRMLMAAAAGEDELSDRDRGAALYWLARIYPDDGYRVASEALEEPGLRRRVGEMALVALATIDDETAVARVIRFVEESDDRQLREQALFWLASMEHPDALAFFDGVLNGG